MLALANVNLARRQIIALIGGALIAVLAAQQLPRESLITGLAASRAAHRELRGSKCAYARVVSTTADVSKPGEVLLTNVWWFDQIAAPLYGTRTFLYAGTEQVATEIVGELTRARIDRVTLVTTREDGGAELDGALDGTCFRIVDTRVIPERSLRFASARCGNQ